MLMCGVRYLCDDLRPYLSRTDNPYHGTLQPGATVPNYPDQQNHRCIRRATRDPPPREERSRGQVQPQLLTTCALRCRTTLKWLDRYVLQKIGGANKADVRHVRSITCDFEPSNTPLSPSLASTNKLLRAGKTGTTLSAQSASRCLL